MFKRQRPRPMCWNALMLATLEAFLLSSKWPCCDCACYFLFFSECKMLRCLVGTSPQFRISPLLSFGLDKKWETYIWASCRMFLLSLHLNLNWKAFEQADMENQSLDSVAESLPCCIIFCQEGSLPKWHLTITSDTVLSWSWVENFSVLFSISMHWTWGKESKYTNF